MNDDIFVAEETTFGMADDAYLEPDFVFYPESVGPVGLNTRHLRLVIEIADSSLSFHLGRKAAVYAAFGIPELWVMNAKTYPTAIHRNPTLLGYRSTMTIDETDVLEATLGPGLIVSLSNLDRPA